MQKLKYLGCMLAVAGVLQTGVAFANPYPGYPPPPPRYGQGPAYHPGYRPAPAPVPHPSYRPAPAPVPHPGYRPGPEPANRPVGSGYQQNASVYTDKSVISGFRDMLWGDSVEKLYSLYGSRVQQMDNDQVYWDIANRSFFRDKMAYFQRLKTETEQEMRQGITSYIVKIDDPQVSGNEIVDGYVTYCFFNNQLYQVYMLMFDADNFDYVNRNRYVVQNNLISSINALTGARLSVWEGVRTNVICEGRMNNTANFKEVSWKVYGKNNDPRVAQEHPVTNIYLATSIYEQNQDRYHVAMKLVLESPHLEQKSKNYAKNKTVRSGW